MASLTFIFSYDLWFYASHLALHHRSMYYLHKQHHTHVNPKWTDTNDASAFENGFQLIGLFLPFLFLSIRPIDFFTAWAFIGARGLMRHDDRFTFIVGNHHLLHHKYKNYNFGERWIDALCGTTYPNFAEHKRGLIFFL